MRASFLALALIAAPALAQQDPMALQRCIWACLSQSPGAASPQYNQCVAQRCTPMAQPRVSAWSSGVATDGVHRFATTQAEQGMAFTYFCTPGRSYFVLADVPVPPNNYRFLIGQTDYVVTLAGAPGQLSVSLPFDHAFTQAIRHGGDMLSIRDMQGLPVVRFSLRGADQHIGQAGTACFGQM